MSELGAYGLRVRGLPGAARWMQPQAPDAPVLEVRASEAPADGSPSHVDDDSADLGLLGGGRLRARRGEGIVRFALPSVPPDADLLHPYLAPAAALAWHWAGREAIHGGAVVTAAGAVLVLGVKEAGKSTTLAWLAEREGLTVMADDLAVVGAEGVLAGPRSIDLRAEGATGGASVRDGDRLRVSLPPAPACAPVAGCVVLEWGPAIAATPVPVHERPAVLARERSFYRLAGDPGTILDLAAKPMFTLARPRDREALPLAARALIDLFA